MAYYQIALRILLSFIIAVSPIILINSANAANVGGWSLSNAVAQGASTVYDATKNVVINGKDFVKDSWVKITPTATGVAKVLSRGVAAYALSIAVEQIIGADYSWWVDGNLVKYRVPTDPNNVPKCWFHYDVGCFASSSSAAISSMSHHNTTAPDSYRAVSYQNYISNNNLTLTVYLYKEDKLTAQIYTFSYIDNPAYNPEADDEERSIPLEVVAQKVISNAENGDTHAQVATTAAAADVVAEAEKDEVKARPIVNQAEANAETKPADADAAASANTGAATATPQADPVTGDQAPPTDISLKFPVFCNWAPTICEAAQVVISFPNTLTGWYNDTKTKAEEWAASIAQSWAAAKEWATTEKPEQPTELEIPQPEQQTIDTDVNFNASCPAPYTLASFTAFGSSHNWTIDFSDMCSAITTFVRPVVIAMGALSAALILGGVRDNG